MPTSITTSRSPLDQTDRSTVRRKPDRADYDRHLVDAILDEALVCHVGFVADSSPRVIPTTYGRIGDDLYLHGATGNAALRALCAGAEACVTVTLLDGLVLARSAFHHSMNYRSVMLFGRAEKVTDPDEKLAAVLAIVDHIEPGRSGATRPPTADELRATLVARLPIREGSAKVRTGGPIDEPDDYALAHWAGVIPLTLVRGEPRSTDLAPPLDTAATRADDHGGTAGRGPDGGGRWPST